MAGAYIIRTMSNDVPFYLRGQHINRDPALADRYETCFEAAVALVKASSVGEAEWKAYMRQARIVKVRRVVKP